MAKVLRIKELKGCHTNSLTILSYVAGAKIKQIGYYAVPSIKDAIQL